MMLSTGALIGPGARFSTLRTLSRAPLSVPAVSLPASASSFHEKVEITCSSARAAAVKMIAVVRRRIVFMVGVLFLLVVFEELVKGGRIETALGVEPAEQPLVVVGRVVLVEDLDFLDEPVEAQTDGRIRDAVGSSEFLERTRREDESLHEDAVFIAQEFDPTLGRRLGH